MNRRPIVSVPQIIIQARDANNNSDSATNNNNNWGMQAQPPSIIHMQSEP